MAAPRAHIFLALQMLAGPFKGLFQEREFLVGTSFPDIRYLGVIAREKTHAEQVALRDIINEKDAFKAGMLFHAFVDEQREAFMVQKGVYKKIPDFAYTSQALKFAEDEILKKVFDVVPYKSYFDQILPQEKKFKISGRALRTWHTFLQEYFSGKYPPKQLLMKYFDLQYPHASRLTQLVFLWWYGWKIEKTMKLIIKNKQLTNTILDFYLGFVDRYTIDS